MLALGNGKLATDIAAELGQSWASWASSASIQYRYGYVRSGYAATVIHGNIPES